mmetsp:Transcript_6013/g.9552  ORF Transcript_6013/g.9552 Transcript_6013/m.9552 type:complete len:162 (+) Transcript_6013:45-530(+)
MSEVMQLFNKFREAIRGSEITLSLSLFIAYMVVRMLGRKPEEKKPKGTGKLEDRPNEVLTFKEYTKEELGKYNGTVMGKPLLLAIKGKVFNVTERADMYGPGAAYGALAGKNANRMLGKMALEPDELDPSTEDFGQSEWESLNQWLSFFEGKYEVVGSYVD